MDKDGLKKQAFEFLDAVHVASVATSSKTGEPRVSAIYYVVEPDFTFHFITTGDSTKVKNLRENPRIAFTVFKDGDPVTVQGGGNAEIIETGIQDILLALSKKLDTHNAREWPLLTLPHDSYVAVRVKPEWLTWLTLDMNHPETYKEGYYQLIP